MLILAPAERTEEVSQPFGSTLDHRPPPCLAAAVSTSFLLPALERLASLLDMIIRFHY